jgi:hypothetical protein
VFGAFLVRVWCLFRENVKVELNSVEVELNSVLWVL